MRDLARKLFILIQIIFIAIGIIVLITNKSPDDWRETFGFEMLQKEKKGVPS